MIHPGAEGPFPQQRAVEGIAGDQLPIAQEPDRSQRRLVHDVEDAAPGGDRGTHAGQFLVTAAPARFADPLDGPRNVHAAVAGDGVVVGAVQEVRPVVDVGGTRLDEFVRRQLSVVRDEDRDAVRDEDAQEFCSGN